MNEPASNCHQTESLEWKSEIRSPKPESRRRKGTGLLDRSLASTGEVQISDFGFVPPPPRGRHTTETRPTNQFRLSNARRGVLPFLTSSSAKTNLMP